MNVCIKKQTVTLFSVSTLRYYDQITPLVDGNS